jgi:hypothetical protein
MNTVTAQNEAHRISNVKREGNVFICKAMLCGNKAYALGTVKKDG